MVKRVMDEFGKVDILVNNAGVVAHALVTDITEEEWDLVMGVNLKGPFLCCKYVVPHMIAQKAGKIVNIGSIEGREGLMGFAHYTPSKAGLHMLTDQLAKELSLHNINVNCIAPGVVLTPMLEHFLRRSTPESGLMDAVRDLVKGGNLFGREVTTEDVNNAMLFLVSEESRNMTGYTFYVDAGHMRVGLRDTIRTPRQ
jgi:NAD(P)-dependent dehydrogenase (short-subunit alcohol dehydrogenase family)